MNSLRKLILGLGSSTTRPAAPKPSAGFSRSALGAWKQPAHRSAVILRPRETLLPYRSTASPIRGHRPKNRRAGNAICSKVRKSFERRELIDLNERRDPTKAIRWLVELGLKAKGK